jgi:regulator of RNase E activity RraA
VIDMLQKGDVLVIDLFGKIAYGAMTGDNLTAAIVGATGNGFVIDGSVRDLDGILEQNVPVYFRDSHVLPLRDVMLTGVNVPIRIGSVTVMPGDLVVGDSEGVTFIPPPLVAEVAKEAQETELKDVWTKAKLSSGKYRSSQLYPAIKDPQLKKEYDSWLENKKKELSSRE